MNGTVRETKSGAIFINYPDDQQIMAGVRTAIAPYIEDGWHIVGITNQMGVSKGYKSFQFCVFEQRKTLELLPALRAIYFCPDEGETCWRVSPEGHEKHKISEITTTYRLDKGFRKPGTGMVELAWSESPIKPELKDCLFVGDREEDSQCANAAGIPFMRAYDWRKGGFSPQVPLPLPPR